MRPDYHKAIIDTIRFYGWKKIMYLYDSHDGEYIFTLSFQILYTIQQNANAYGYDVGDEAGGCLNGKLPLHANFSISFRTSDRFFRLIYARFNLNVI